MADYTIDKGTPDWDVPLNADLADIDTRLTSIEGETSGQNFYLLVASSTAPTAVKAKADYVCDGIADQIEIQAAVDAAFAQNGGIVQLSTGKFNTTFPVTLHPTITLQGTHGDQIFNPGQLVANSEIAIQPGFTGGAAIVMLGQTAGGYTGKSADSRIYHLTINGDLSPAGIHGIQASDYIHGAVLADVAVVRPTGKGIYTFTENGSQPFSWTFHRVLVDNAGDVGIHLINHTDCTMVDVISIGSNAFGFQLSNMPNSRFIGCRAEWSEAHGYKIEGNFGTGAGSGGMLFSGCSTDRNGQNGFDITSTGNAPITLDGVNTRRDGRNGGTGGGGYAGIFASGATTPLVITGWTQYPGVDDDGTKTNSPSHGGVFQSNSSVQISNAYVHGALDGIVNGGANTIFQTDGVVNASGLTSAPVRSASQGQFNVKNFGAVGNDTADDTVAIQAALTAAAVAGGVVYIPRGTYKLTAAVTISPNVRITGAGSSVSVLHQTSTTANAITGVDIGSVTIDNIGLTGPGSGSGKGISFTLTSNNNTQYLDLYDLKVSGFGSDGINIKTAIVSTFRRILSQNNGGYGFNLNGTVSPASPGTSCQLSGCFANANTTGGYYLLKMAYVNLSACAADNNPIGYNIEEGWNNTLVGCGSEGNTTGVKINGGYGNDVTGQFVYNNVGVGIWVTGTAHLVGLNRVTDVTPGGGATNFIKVDAGSFCTINGQSNTTANALNGTVSILDDGGGGIVIPGYAFFANQLEVASDLSVDNGNVSISGTGKGLRVKSGTNAKAGTVTANGTTAVTVSTTAITANSVVVFGLKTQAGTAATTAPFMSAVTAGTSFQIKSSAGDTSVYNWVILDLI